MMTDRQRTEAILFPVWLLNVVECGVNDKAAEDYKRCTRILGAAADEALKGCDEKRRAALRRRVARVHNTITADYRRNGVHVDKIGLIALYTLQAVLDAGYLEIDEGSPLSKALDAIIEALLDAFAEARLDASAKKHAAKLLSQLQAMDYFDGVMMPREAV